jgi:hypothetical protein
VIVSIAMFPGARSKCDFSQLRGFKNESQEFPKRLESGFVFFSPDRIHC